MRITCGDRRFNQWGYQVARCDVEYGHKSDHVDMQAGRTWRNR